MRFPYSSSLLPVVCGIACAVGFAGAASAQVLVVSDALNRQLYSVNTTTAATTLIGSYGLGPGINIAGLAWDDASATLYGSSTGTGTNNLYRIDTSTGAATSIGSLGSEIFMHGLAFGPGGLYGGSTTTLYSINPATGAATSIGGYGGPTQMHGLDFDATGRLVGSLGVVTGNLYTIDAATGAATLLAPTVRLNSIAFHPTTGELFGVANPSIGETTCSLYRVNATTGDATLIGVMPNVGNSLALEFIVPGPGAWGLVVVGGAVGARRRRSWME